MIPLKLLCSKPLQVLIPERVRMKRERVCERERESERQTNRKVERRKVKHLVRKIAVQLS